MEICPETVKGKQAHWPATHAIFKLHCLPDKNNHKRTSENPTDALNIVESFIGVLQIPGNLTHDKLSVSQQLHSRLKVPQCKQDMG